MRSLFIYTLVIIVTLTTLFMLFPKPCKWLWNNTMAGLSWCFDQAVIPLTYLKEQRDAFNALPLFNKKEKKA